MELIKPLKEQKKLRVAAFSDSHWEHEDMVLPMADLLLCAGDFSGYGTEQELIEFNEWLGRVKSRYRHGVVLVLGNHELAAQKVVYSRLLEIFSNAKLLMNEEVVIAGKRIWGTPWVPTYGSWAYMLSEERLYKEVYSQIPEGLDLLICHGPAFMCLDRTMSGVNAGSKAMRKRLSEMSNPPKNFVFGHIHSFEDRKGNIVNREFHEEFGCRMYNVSIMSERYSPDFNPTVMEI